MIEYQCKKCEKKFKVKAYSQLEVIYNKDTSLPTGRKCDSCGNEIFVDDKSITI